MIFDLNNFENTLFKESREVFPIIIEQFRDEGIYSLALYTSGDSWGYLFPTIATYTGLKEVISKYKKNEFYKSMSIEELQSDLKWSPCDSPRHGSFVSTLPKTEDLLQEAENLMENLWDNGSEEECEELHEQLVSACLVVLKKLDESGVFSALDRSSFVLNLLNGDQGNEERIKRAWFLNPSSVAREYEKEI